MRARTFLALQAEALALADCGRDPHILEADDGDGGFINLAALWVNQGIAELWRKCVRVYPDRYLQQATFSTTTGTPAYDMAAILGVDDFLALRRIDLIRGAQRIPIEPFTLQDAPYHFPTPTQGSGLTRYRLIGQGADGTGTQIYFDPDPGTNTYALWYVQAPPVLVADADTFDGIAGLEDWVTLFAAKRMCIRQETPTGEIDMEMARIEASITSTAANRDVGRAPRIADVRPRGMYRR